MISIHYLDGYKYIGEAPDAKPDDYSSNFRDNLTYLNLSFSDWEEDKNKLRFICQEHLSYLDMVALEGLLTPYVVDNSIGPLHIVLREDDSDEAGGMKFMTMKGADPAQLFFQSGDEKENIFALIARKKQFYRNELPALKAAELAAFLAPRKSRKKAT